MSAHDAVIDENAAGLSKQVDTEVIEALQAATAREDGSKSVKDKKDAVRIVFESSIVFLRDLCMCPIAV